MLYLDIIIGKHQSNIQYTMYIVLYSTSVHNPTPGSGMSIARKFLLTVLTQFCDRRLFLYLFHHNYEG